MTVLEAVPDIHRWDIRILATDLDSDVLERARRGIYSGDRLRYMGDAPRERFFRRLDGEGNAYEVTPGAQTARHHQVS